MWKSLEELNRFNAIVLTLCWFSPFPDRIKFHISGTIKRQSYNKLIQNISLAWVSFFFYTVGIYDSILQQREHFGLWQYMLWLQAWVLESDTAGHQDLAMTSPVLPGTSELNFLSLRFFVWKGGLIIRFTYFQDFCEDDIS